MVAKRPCRQRASLKINLSLILWNPNKISRGNEIFEALPEDEKNYILQLTSQMEAIPIFNQKRNFFESFEDIEKDLKKLLKEKLAIL